VRHFYNRDAKDPALYHLVIDSTALAPEQVVEVIVAAAR
jgi:cytidylate kinase